MSKPIKKKITSAKNLVEDQLIGDGYNNFTAKLGLNTENLSSIATYTLGNLISRNHVQLESIYRTSWIAGQVIDTVAEDMTKEGIMMMSKLSPDDIQKMSASLTELGIWQKICSTIKWARLYGGAIAVMLIDGADYEKPFDATKVRKDSFKGLAVFDRWQLEPSYNELVTELGPDMGKPKFYKILPAMETMSTIKVHYSRVVRLEGIEMPYYQKKYDNLWGMSVIERMLDRLMAFDSATQGAAQLIYKAHLRVVQIDGLRQALAMGGKTESAVIKQFQYIRLMQSNEGITLLDKNDTFTPHSYTFAGLAEMLIQFGQQISGAVNIPLVRLFGQSPSGFNSGEADLRNYYDNVGKLQETMLRMPVHKILETLCMSVNGKPLPDDFEFDFNSLWQPSEVEKSQIVNNDVSALNIAFQSGMITKKIAMKELAQNSHVTGRFSNITDEDIEKAEEEPPEHQGMGSGLGGEENQEVDLKGLQEKIGQEPEPEADDTIGEKSLEDLEAELNELDGGGEKSLEDLEKELNNLDPPSLEQLEKELSKLGPEPTIEELETILKNIKTNFDPELMQLEKQLEEIDTSTPATPPKKMTTDNRGVLAKAWGSVKGFFTGDKQIHAPKGGITIKGKKFTGGEFIPKEGGYQEAYLKQQKGQSASPQQEGKAEPQGQAEVKKRGNLGDYKLNAHKNLTSITKSPLSNQQRVRGTLSPETAKAIVGNARVELEKYSRYLSTTSYGLARDSIYGLADVLSDPSLSHIDAGHIDRMMTDSVRKMVNQEVESNRQQFTDHGIRHIQGNIDRMDQMLDTVNEGKTSATEKLMGYFIMINHDIGYTAPEVRQGGNEGVMASKNHRQWSADILEQQRNEWNKDKIFSPEQYDRIVDIVKTHDDPKIDKNDVLGTSVRLADNLALFAKEKLPTMFSDIPKGKDLLVKMGEAAKNKDEGKFKEYRDTMYKSIDDTEMNSNLKRDLKSAVKEISFLTPKFTLGVLAGEISKIEGGKDHINIDIQHNQWDSFLQQYFDMGQHQTKNFLKAYGITDFSKTSYDLGGFVTLRVKGYGATHDEQLRAPKGGVTVKGKKFKGGEFIPTAGGYATEYKKMQKKSSSSKQQSNKQGSSKSQKASSKVDKEKLAMLKTKLKKMSVQEGTRRTVKTADFLHAKRSDDGKVVMSNGKSLPKHLAKTSIPPMWKNLLINPDKDGKCWVIAFDENGKRAGGVYNPDHVAERDVKKDAMLNDLNKNLHTIYKQIDEGQKSKETFQKALITKVLALTGARVGSNEEALSPKGKSYGASTLEGRHIIPQKDGSIKLQFDGKGLKQNIYEVKDKQTASTLLKLKQKAGDNGRLFGEKYDDLLGYVKELDGGGFTPHNFRTKIATDTAMATIASMDPPTNLKEYKKAMKLVAIAVGEKLNDTPATVLKNYIVSSVWADWKSKAGIE